VVDTIGVEVTAIFFCGCYKKQREGKLATTPDNGYNKIFVVFVLGNQINQSTINNHQTINQGGLDKVCKYNQVTDDTALAREPSKVSETLKRQRRRRDSLSSGMRSSSNRQTKEEEEKKRKKKEKKKNNGMSDIIHAGEQMQSR
jgi:hypothetical protein